MEFVIREARSQRVIHAGEVLKVAADSSHFAEQVLESPGTVARPSQHIIHIPGATLVSYKYQHAYEMSLLRSFGGEVIKLHISLQGRLSIGLDGMSETLVLTGGRYALFYSACLDETYTFSAVDPQQFVELIFDKAYFLHLVGTRMHLYERFCGNIQQGETAVLQSEDFVVNPRLRQTLTELFNAPYKGEVKSLYVQSKTIELLAQLASQYTPATRAEASSLPERDLTKLYEARDLLLARLADPPSLMELCRLVGLNDFKLKKGFKEVFGQTVYGFVLETRLEQARQQLLDTDESILGVALQNGYGSLASFSAAFRKKFGVSPREMRRRA